MAQTSSTTIASPTPDPESVSVIGNQRPNPLHVVATPGQPPPDALLRHLPASYRMPGHERPYLIPSSTDHIKDELSVNVLNKVHRWIWLAGMAEPPMPLNYQRFKSRNIVVCEDTRLHLVWTPGRIYLKPLPEYLLDDQFWQGTLASDMGGDLYRLALGFLWSYVGLIQYQSDFTIAKAEALLPSSLEWDKWVAITTNLMAMQDLTTTKDEMVNKRYHYGELQLSRLNMIFWAHGHWGGYLFPYNTLGEMFFGNIAPLAGIIVYIVLVLTAMQVGLATDELKDSRVFQDASYRFAMFSIFFPIGAVILVLFLVGGLGAVGLIYVVLREITRDRDSNPDST